MGAGASNAKGEGNLANARKSLADGDEGEADKLFDQLDGDQNGRLSVIELYDAVQNAHVDWDFEDIKASMALFDDDGDDKVGRAEFKKALAEMTTKASKKKGKKKGRKSAAAAKAQPKRSWTFKDAREKRQSEAEAQAELEAAPAPAPAPAAVPVLDVEKTPTDRQSEYWQQIESQPVWHVILKKTHVWNQDDDALAEAMARARSIGKTPLLLDGTKGDYDTSVLDDFFCVERKAQVLDARQMLEDEKTGARSYELIMKEARKQLVEAMRTGTAFYLRLGRKPPKFVGSDGFVGEDTLPLDIFHAEKVAELSAYSKESQLKNSNPSSELNSSNHGLWKSKHPLAKILREGDLDLKGDFFVPSTFEVVASSQLEEGKYREGLLTLLPELETRFQPILVRAPLRLSTASA